MIDARCRFLKKAIKSTSSSWNSSIPLEIIRSQVPTAVWRLSNWAPRGCPVSNILETRNQLKSARWKEPFFLKWVFYELNQKRSHSYAKKLFRGWIKWNRNIEWVRLAETEMIEGWKWICEIENNSGGTNRLACKPDGWENMEINWRTRSSLSRIILTRSWGWTENRIQVKWKRGIGEIARNEVKRCWLRWRW